MMSGEEGVFMAIRTGDIVTRKSYGNDILFLVLGVSKTRRIASLAGLEVRLLTDAPIDDLIKIDKTTLDTEEKKQQKKSQESLRLIRQERRLMREKNQWQQTGYTPSDEDEGRKMSFEIPGKVLHLDGDGRYMEKCLQLYRELGIRVNGFQMPETEMPNQVYKLLQEHQPDILILTGHDSIRKNVDSYSIDSYRHSRFFVQAVREARKYERNKDRLVIFAGACQSHFEQILEAGANFASSPKRINIHVLDPVYIAEKVAFTSLKETINVFELAKNSISGTEGLGGIETFGTFRLGVPITEQMKGQKQ
jgi:spore coat assembly protein